MPDSLARRKILGVLVPYFNSVVEPELATLRPPGVSNQTARFTLDADVLEDIVGAAAKLTACGTEALIVGLSTESFAGGLELLEQGARELAERTALPVFTASHATQAALRALGARRIAVATPFDADGNTHVRSAFERAGFEVAAVDGLACPALDRIAQSSRRDVLALFERIAATDADTLVQVGTGLPVIDLVDELEGRLGRPIVACNAASYWQALRESGIHDRLEGVGQLFSEH